MLTESIEVESSTIAEAFIEESGGGIQYRHPNSIEKLLADGSIVEVI